MTPGVRNGHPAGNEGRVRVHELDAAHAPPVDGIEIRNTQPVCGLRRKRQRRNAHHVERVVDEVRKVRSDRRDVDAARAQSVTQRVDARDDAVDDGLVAFGEEADTHDELSLRRSPPAPSRPRKRAPCERTCVTQGTPSFLRPEYLTGRRPSCYLTAVHRDPSGPGAFDRALGRGSPTTATTSSANHDSTDR